MCEIDYDRICISFTNVDVIYYCLQNSALAHQIK